MATEKQIPESEWPWPQEGGSYLRNLKTGALTLIEPDTDQQEDN